MIFHLIDINMTKEEIIDVFETIATDRGDFYSYSQMMQAMQTYADQETAEKDKEITKLKAELGEFLKLAEYKLYLKRFNLQVTDYSKDAPLKKLKNP
jgi:hypothetical protein